MPVNISRPAVAISFAGLALFCINPNEENRCEVGIIGCERHRPVLDIQEMTFDLRSGKPMKSSLVPHSLSLDEDIWIKVDRPRTKGVSMYRGGQDFNRLDDRGDERDFRWVVDLEGVEFHQRRLPRKAGERGIRSGLRPLIFISDGMLYTENRTDEKVALVSSNPGQQPKALGRVAFKIGADLFPGEGGSVELSNGRRNSIKLHSKRHTRYSITIENLCSVNRGQGMTDFRLFYEILNVPDREQFDIQRIVENGRRGDLGSVLAEHPDFSLDNYPQVCLSGFLGQTDSLAAGRDDTQTVQGE